jgi:Uma2 family endonuclease
MTLAADACHGSLAIVTVLEALNAPRAARLKAQDFMLLASNGAFDTYARAELIDGEIFVVNAQFRRHAITRRRLMRGFEDALDARADGLGVLDECNIAFDDGTMPQPDITLTTAAEPEDGPIPLDSVMLIVEIADTTLAHDLGPRRERYARYAVPEYWVVDIKAKVVHQFWSVAAEGYAERGEVPLGERIEARTIAGLGVETGGI